MQILFETILRKTKNHTKVQMNSVEVKRCQRVRAIIWTVSFFVVHTQQFTDIFTQRN